MVYCGSTVIGAVPLSIVTNGPSRITVNSRLELPENVIPPESGGKSDNVLLLLLIAH
jgi:hypothetical protein